MQSIIRARASLQRSEPVRYAGNYSHIGQFSTSRVTLFVPSFSASAGNSVSSSQRSRKRGQGGGAGWLCSTAVSYAANHGSILQFILGCSSFSTIVVYSRHCYFGINTIFLSLFVAMTLHRHGKTWDLVLFSFHYWQSTLAKSYRTYKRRLQLLFASLSEQHKVALIRLKSPGVIKSATAHCVHSHMPSIGV